MAPPAENQEGRQETVIRGGLSPLWILVLMGGLFCSMMLPHPHAEAQLLLRDDPEGVLRFAHHLLEEGDAYRAATEYKVFLFLFPDHPRANEARFHLGKALLMDGRWDEAFETFRGLARAPQPDTVWSPRAALQMGETLLLSGQPASAARILEQTAQRPGWEEIRPRAFYGAAWAWLKARRWDEAVRALDSVDPHSHLGDLASALRQEVSEGVPRLPRRSPWVAGVLAALLPGSGHLYSGRPKEALTSFLLNGTFIAGAAWAVSEGYLFTGGILSFFELGWYLGGISTAAQSAVRFNEDHEARWLELLERRWRAPMDGGLSKGLSVKALSFRF